jgi:integral membrane protein
LSASDNFTQATAGGTDVQARQPSATASPAKIKPALLRYRALAWTTGLWLLLLTGEIIAKYGFGVHTPNWIAVVHGWVYFIYLIVTADLAVKVRWPAGRTIGTLLAGTIPLLSFFVEHINAQQVKNAYGLSAAPRP